MKDNHHAVSHAHDHSHAETHHGGTVKLYVVFALVLCVITFFEWLIFKKRTEWAVSNQTLVVTLLLLSLVKFTMVCGWYMHLRYDKKFLTNIFLVSMIMAVCVFVAVNLMVFH